MPRAVSATAIRVIFDPFRPSATMSDPMMGVTRSGASFEPDNVSVWGFLDSRLYIVTWSPTVEMTMMDCPCRK